MPTSILCLCLVYATMRTSTLNMAAIPLRGKSCQCGNATNSKRLTVISIYSDDVQEIFDPIVDQIVELVEQQVLRVKQMGESVAVSQTSIVSTS